MSTICRERDICLLRWLPFAGALPFVFGALAMLMGLNTLPVLGSVQEMVLAYGLAILSFMAGVHWGQHLSGLNCRTNLLVTSNVITVSAWLGYLTLAPYQFAILLMELFVALLLVDRQLSALGSLNSAYAQTRHGVTILVVLSLAAVAILAT